MKSHEQSGLSTAAREVQPPRSPSTCRLGDPHDPASTCTLSDPHDPASTCRLSAAGHREEVELDPWVDVVWSVAAADSLQLQVTELVGGFLDACIDRLTSTISRLRLHALRHTHTDKHTTADTQPSCLFSRTFSKQVKVAHTRMPSVGFQHDGREQFA